MYGSVAQTGKPTISSRLAEENGERFGSSFTIKRRESGFHGVGFFLENPSALEKVFRLEQLFQAQI